MSAPTSRAIRGRKARSAETLPQPASRAATDAGRPRLGGSDRVIERLVHEAADGRADSQPGQEGEAPGFGHPYQAVAVAASMMPWASSQRSASMAALQPSAAAVTACR